METEVINAPLTQDELIVEQDTSIANQLIDLIRRKYELIENYNNLRSVLVSQNHDDLVEVIDDIVPAESGIIGVLTGMLVDVQPMNEPNLQSEVVKVEKAEEQ